MYVVPQTGRGEKAKGAGAAWLCELCNKHFRTFDKSQKGNHFCGWTLCPFCKQKHADNASAKKMKNVIKTSL